MEYDYVIKTLLIGSTSVGKSSISNQFTESFFDNYGIQTIGVDLKIKCLKCFGKKIKIQLWDTAGHERFKSITSSYYRGADCVILVFDLTRKDSFDDLHFWISEIKKYSPDDTEYFLVGNKVDLPKRVVEHVNIEKFIVNNKISNYLEVSAKDNINIDKLFKKIAVDIYSKKILNIKYVNFEKPIKPSTILISDKNKKRCCMIL